jgi:transposase-like protein
MTRIVKRYTKEFKQEAVNVALKPPSIVHTAKELGIPAEPFIHGLTY